MINHTYDFADGTRSYDESYLRKMYDHIFDTRMINHIIRLAAWVLGWLGWLPAWAGWASCLGSFWYLSAKGIVFGNT